MDRKAQAGLEYLMTYGWALVLIATVVGVLVFIATPSEGSGSWSTSTKFLVKGSNVGSVIEADAIFQNAAGNDIKITSVSLSGLGDRFGQATLNGRSFRLSYNDWCGYSDSLASNPITVKAGNELVFEGLNSSTELHGASIAIAYKDQFGLERTEQLSFAKGAASVVGRRGDIQLCDYSDWYDFDSGGSLIPFGNTDGDLSKGNGGSGGCCDFAPENGATQVDTLIPSADFESVTCGAGDGRDYTSGAVAFSTPYYYVICLRTSNGRYVKYIGEMTCCAGFVLNWEITD